MVFAVDIEIDGAPETEHVQIALTIASSSVGVTDRFGVYIPVIIGVLYITREK